MSTLFFDIQLEQQRTSPSKYFKAQLHPTSHASPLLFSSPLLQFHRPKEILKVLSSFILTTLFFFVLFQFYLLASGSLLSYYSDFSLWNNPGLPNWDPNHQQDPDLSNSLIFLFIFFILVLLLFLWDRYRQSHPRDRIRFYPKHDVIRRIGNDYYLYKSIQYPENGKEINWFEFCQLMASSREYLYLLRRQESSRALQRHNKIFSYMEQKSREKDAVHSMTLVSFPTKQRNRRVMIANRDWLMSPMEQHS